jgi:hypothetical protein
MDRYKVLGRTERKKKRVEPCLEKIVRKVDIERIPWEVQSFLNPCQEVSFSASSNH